jgi:hypothetical protein
MTNNKNCLTYLAPLCLLCTGCGQAPSVDIIGSFFPAWMICLSVAVMVGPVALFYPSVVILFTSLLWLIFFR